MKITLQFILTALTVLICHKVHAVGRQQALQEAAVKAQSFLCTQSFCLKSLPPIDVIEVNGYLGYVDGDYSRISISPALSDADSQLAIVHELTHVYRRQRAPDEEQWLNEGLAKFMEYKYSTVWPVSYITRLKKERALNFADYQPNGGGYMSSFLLTLYLYNHFGQERLFTKLMNSQKTGWENVLSAIHELSEEGALKIPAEFISKEGILRHFAVSLWMNDRFAAKYALFYLDARYEALNTKPITQASIPLTSADTGMGIQFTKWYPSMNAAEVFSIINESPFEIQAANPNDRPVIFISIFH